MTAPNANPTAALPRPHGWTTLRDLHCPDGHHIRQDAVVLEHGAIRCKHKTQGRPHEKGQECGAWLYVLGSIGWRVVEVGGCERVELGDDVYIVPVTWRELEEIRRRRLTASQTLTFLGIAGGMARADRSRPAQ